MVAVRRLFGPKVEVKLEHSIDRGIYCEIRGKEISKKDITALEKEMYKIVAEDLNFTRVSVSRLDAIKFFKKEKRMDKVNVLRYISNTFVTLYRLDEVYDYFFTDLAYSTKDINSFKLTYIKDNGFVLSLPTVFNPECTLDYKHHKLVFDKFLDYTRWGDVIGIENAADLNRIVSVGNYDEAIRLAEANFDNQLAQVSNKIYSKKNQIKVVLMAGPSSSEIGRASCRERVCQYV